MAAAHLRCRRAPVQALGEVNGEEKATRGARLSPVEEVPTVLDLGVRGMLSMFSLKYDGYPSGSMADFACDAHGSAILAIISLAFHSEDLSANPKCSLLVARDLEDRTDLMITLHSDAIPVDEKDREVVRATYLSKHPNAFWIDFGDFQFMRIEPKVVRYVSSVATALLGSGEFLKEDYRTAKVDPIAQFAKPVGVDSAYMLDLDSLGFGVKLMLEAIRQGTYFKLRVPFPCPAQDRKDVKTLIVEMLQAAKADRG